MGSSIIQRLWPQVRPTSNGLLPQNQQRPASVFRVASNAANNNGSPTGDHIRTLNLTLPQTIECSYALASETISFESDGGDGSAAVTAPEGCDWTATTEDDWITIAGEASGSGNDTVTFTVGAHITALDRSGSIMVEDQALTVTQTGVACSYTLSRSSISFDSDEGNSSVSVSTPEGCDWTATPTESWITITEGASGGGDGAVNFAVDANPETAARSGSIMVEDQTLSISQTGQQMADLIFPQFVNGEIGGVPNATQVILRNNAPEIASGQIRFRESSSLFAAVPVGGQLTDTIDFMIASQGTFDIETDGTGTLQTGVVEVFVDGETDSVEGTEIFSVLGNFVSVPSSRPDPAPRAYISVNLEESSGIAAYNPDGSNAVLVDMTLLDATGAEMAMGQLTLQPNEQLTRFVDEPGELFPDFFAANPEPFTGTLNFNVVEGGIAVLGLIQKRAGGQLIAVGTSSQDFLPVQALADSQSPTSIPGVQGSNSEAFAETMVNILLKPRLSD